MRLLVVIIFLVAGCAQEEEPLQLSDESADIFGNLPDDPCYYLEDYVNDQGELLNFGYYFGVAGELSIGLDRALSGVDMVWDISHYQAGASYYIGAGVSVPALGASVQAYHGLAYGFESTVADWNGYFVTSTLSVSVPLAVSTQLSGGVAVSTYVSGVDENENYLIEPSEVLVPPEGVYGWGWGISLNFDFVSFLPDWFVLSPELSESRWYPFQGLTRIFYDYFKDSRLWLIGDWREELVIHLVDAYTGEECDPEWPSNYADRGCVDADDMETECDPDSLLDGRCVYPDTLEYCEPTPTCVIEFGERDWSHERRTRHIFYALCWLSGQCITPLGYGVSQTALSAAHLRDSDMTYAEMCPGQ